MSNTKLVIPKMIANNIARKPMAVSKRDVLKVMIVDVIRLIPRSLLDLKVDALSEPSLRDITLAYLGETVRQLLDDGYIRERGPTSSIMPTYELAGVDVVSELRAKLLPHRDPVVETHAIVSAWSCAA
jgi:hypothetical protein